MDDDNEKFGKTLGIVEKKRRLINQCRTQDSRRALAISKVTENKPAAA